MNRSRSTRKRNQDLELRLGHSELEKQSTLLTSQNVALDNLIIVEDDDDEVQLSSSRIFGHNGVRPSSSRISVQVCSCYDPVPYLVLCCCFIVKVFS
jgi:hypothetical protein